MSLAIEGTGIVRAICPSPFISSAALRRKKKKQTRNTASVAQESWPRRHKADGGQEELDERWVSLPSGLPRRRRNLQLQSMRSGVFDLCKIPSSHSDNASRSRVGLRSG